MADKSHSEATEYKLAQEFGNFILINDLLASPTALHDPLASYC